MAKVKRTSFAELAGRLQEGLATKPASTGMLSELPIPATSRQDVIAAGKYRELPIELVEGDPNQPRRHFATDDLRSLADTIESQGLLQLPIVRPHPHKAGRYMVVIGERRVRAVRLLGKPTIEVRYEDWDDTRARLAQLIENSESARINVQPWEEARALSELVASGMKVPEICHHLGRSNAYVSKVLSLNSLPPVILELLETRVLKDSESAYLLNSLYKLDCATAEKLCQVARDAGRLERAWIAVELRKARRALKGEPQAGPVAAASFKKRIDALLETMPRRGAPIANVKDRGRRGVTLEIRFDVRDDAETFLERLRR